MARPAQNRASSAARSSFRAAWRLMRESYPCGPKPTIDETKKKKKSRVPTDQDREKLVEALETARRRWRTAAHHYSLAEEAKKRAENMFYDAENALEDYDEAKKTEANNVENRIDIS
jgi:hypothetical protein